MSDPRDKPEERKPMPESRIDRIVRKAALPNDSVCRLQKVVEADFSPYAVEKKWDTFAPDGSEGGVSVNTLTITEWNWGLLRHDIHVLIHRLRSSAKTTPGLSYKGYTGSVQVVGGTNVLYGELVGIRDVVTFESRSVKGFLKAFHDSVDDYLAMCAERDEQPERPNAD